MAAVELTFASDAHSADAIQRAAYRFSDRFSVEIRREGENFRCELHPVEADGEIDEQTLNAFRAEVLDQVLRERIASETAAVRNVVLALAFANTSLTGAEAAATGGQAAEQVENTVPASAGD